MDRSIRTVEDVLTLLDGLFAPATARRDGGGGAGAAWWDGFYADRTRSVPFFAAKPDESLAEYVDGGRVPAGGRALDVGCGPGRNALFLAARGFEVDAVDLSATAIAWAGERAAEAGAGIRFHCADIFANATSGAAPTPTGPYDLVYDSGCFHHLPPHRRVSYLALLERVLAPGGYFALTCFLAGAAGSGSELPDAAFYRAPHAGGSHGGLAYTPGSLRTLFAPLAPLDQRTMCELPPEDVYFGRAFL